jgi:hypothetical protein
MANNGIQGKRKLYATLVYCLGSVGIGSLLVSLGKISGAEYIQGLSTAQYVVMAYLGANAIGAGIQKFGKKNGTDN